MHDQSMASSSFPMGLILVAGDWKMRDLLSQLNEGGSAGQKTVRLFFPLRKTFVVSCQDCYPAGSSALK